MPVHPRVADPATTPVVVACRRTAIGRSHPQRGIFRHVRGDELAAAVVEAARSRTESRGCHRRSDVVDRLHRWQHSQTVRLERGEVRVAHDA